MRARSGRMAAPGPGAGGSRRQRQAARYALNLSLAAASHPDGARALLCAFIQHLVFAREQCHAPYVQLAAAAEAHAVRQLQQRQSHLSGRPGARSSLRLRCGGAGLRRVLQYQQRLAALLSLAAGIPNAVLTCGTVALLLGSSASRPREVYTLGFPGAAAAEDTPPPGDAALAEASRRLLRALVVQGQGIREWDGAPGPTKLFLMFQAPSSSAACDSGSGDGRASVDVCPPGFTPRRGFFVNLRRAFQVDIRLSAAGAPLQLGAGQLQQLQQQQVQQQQPQQQHNGLWEGSPGSSSRATSEGLSQALSTQMSFQEQQQQPQKQQQQPVHGRAAECGVQPGTELLWYQCKLHVKGLRATAS